MDPGPWPQWWHVPFNGDGVAAALGAASLVRAVSSVQMGCTRHRLTSFHSRKLGHASPIWHSKADSMRVFMLCTRSRVDVCSKVMALMTPQQEGVLLGIQWHCSHSPVLALHWSG